MCVCVWGGGVKDPTTFKGEGVFLYRQRRENIKIFIKCLLFIKNSNPRTNTAGFYSLVVHMDL